MKKWIIPILAAVVAVIISILHYADLPARVAIHFGPNSAPDNWVNKPLGAFLLPLLIIAVPALTIISAKFERDDNKRRRAAATLDTVIAIIALLLLTIHTLIITYNLGYEWNVAMVAAIVVGIVFILLGNLLPKFPQNTFSWPKFPEPVFQKKTRLQGRVMMIFGCVFILLAFLPNAAIYPAFFLALALFIIFLIVNMIWRSDSA